MYPFYRWLGMRLMKWLLQEFPLLLHVFFFYLLSNSFLTLREQTLVPLSWRLTHYRSRYQRALSSALRCSSSGSVSRTILSGRRGRQMIRLKLWTHSRNSYSSLTRRSSELMVRVAVQLLWCAILWPACSFILVIPALMHACDTAVQVYIPWQSLSECV